MGLTNQKLRFASYNIFHGGRAEYDMSRIAKNITKNKIDIVDAAHIDTARIDWMHCRDGYVDG